MKRGLLILVVLFFFGISNAVSQAIDAADSIKFELAKATCSGISIDIPVTFFSDDPIYAIDFAMQFDQSKMEFDSIINDKPYLLSAASYNINDSTLRFSSFSMQQLINDSPVVAIRFHLLAGQIDATDFNTITTWLNGDVCSFKISDALPPVLIGGPTGIMLVPGDSITLIAPAGPGFTFSWSTGESTQTINVHDSGTYSLTVTTSGGCLYTDEASVYLSAPLPIELIDFTVNIENDGLILRWSTASEINNDYFTVESSNDGLQWIEKGRLDGAGNSTMLNNYSYKDVFPHKGLNYYRLKQTDFNGVSTCSEIISGIFSGGFVPQNQRLIILSDYSRPDVLFFELEGCQPGRVSARLWDSNGRRLSEMTISVNGVSNRFQLEIPSGLPGGIYLLECTGDSFHQVQKLFRQ